MVIRLNRVARAERTAEPHEHFVHLPTLYDVLLEIWSVIGATAKPKTIAGTR